jgi:ubiquinone/menaquinone biosynthesis C-methylase UbiE
MHRKLWKRIVQFGFRLLYNELAWTYDAVSWSVSLGAWREWQKSALSFIEGQAILEVGHGPGHMLAALEVEGRQPVGLDLSVNMGKLARRRTSAPLIRGRVEELPFVEAAFDSVFSTFPTEEILSPRALAAVHTVLKRGGRFVVLPEAHLIGSSPLHILIESLFHITGQRKGSFGIDNTIASPELPQWRGIRDRFETAGFELSVEHLRLPHSAITLLIGTKPVACA